MARRASAHLWSEAVTSVTSATPHLWSEAVVEERIGANEDEKLDRVELEHASLGQIEQPRRRRDQQPRVSLDLLQTPLNRVGAVRQRVPQRRPLGERARFRCRDLRMVSCWDQNECPRAARL